MIKFWHHFVFVSKRQEKEKTSRAFPSATHAQADRREDREDPGDDVAAPVDEKGDTIFYFLLIRRTFKELSKTFINSKNFRSMISHHFLTFFNSKNFRSTSYHFFVFGQVWTKKVTSFLNFYKFEELLKSV